MLFYVDCWLVGYCGGGSVFGVVFFFVVFAVDADFGVEAFFEEAGGVGEDLFLVGGLDFLHVGFALR